MNNIKFSIIFFLSIFFNFIFSDTSARIVDTIEALQSKSIGNESAPVRMVEFASLTSSDALIQRAGSKLRCKISSLIARRRQYTMADQYSLVVVEVFFESCMQYFSQCETAVK